VKTCFSYSQRLTVGNPAERGVALEKKTVERKPKVLVVVTRAAFCIRNQTLVVIDLLLYLIT